MKIHLRLIFIHSGQDQERIRIETEIILSQWLLMFKVYSFICINHGFIHWNKVYTCTTHIYLLVYTAVSVLLSNCIPRYSFPFLSSIMCTWIRCSFNYIEVLFSGYSFLLALDLYRDRFNTIQHLLSYFI